jgi:hypothetical protein
MSTQAITPSVIVREILAVVPALVPAMTVDFSNAF